MPDLADWPDWYVATQPVLASLGTVGAETPPDPDGVYSWLPFIRLEYLGGPDNGITTTGTLLVAVFAASRSAASQLAGRVRQRLINTPHIVAGAVIDDVETITGPTETPYGDKNKVRMYTATYLARMRRY